MGTSDQSKDRDKDKEETQERATWPKDPKRDRERGQEGEPGMRSARDEMQEAEDRLNQDYDA